MATTHDGKKTRQAPRETVTGAADRFLQETRPRPSWSVLRMPAFWVILLLAAAAILVATLTSCGRQEGKTEPSASATVSATASDTKTAEPSASAEPSPTPEESGPDLPPQVEGAWPVPWGWMTDEGLRYGYADEAGNKLIEPVYTAVQPFSGFGRAIVTDASEQCGVIDREGRLVVPMKPAFITQMANGMLSVGLRSGDGGTTVTAHLAR